MLYYFPQQNKLHLRENNMTKLQQQEQMMYEILIIKVIISWLKSPRGHTDNNSVTIKVLKKGN